MGWKHIIANRLAYQLFIKVDLKKSNAESNDNKFILNKINSL